MQNESEVRLDRVSKMREQGIDPYPAQAAKSHTVAEVLSSFEDLQAAEAQVSVAGRIIAIRQMGGLTFVRLLDGTGSVQVVVREDELTEAYATFGAFADVGDFYGFTGGMFVTKKGERSILAKSFTAHAKAITPLPEKWHGLTDVEQRYRRRELDLISNPEIRSVFETRSRFVSSLRRFLDDRGFLEMETPMLQAVPGGANARPFVTHHNALGVDLYLRIAPELYLKRLLVGGFEKIYEIGRCFRNEGIDYAHNPEFTMLEMYWAYAPKADFLMFLEEMLRTVIVSAIGKLQVTSERGELDFGKPWPQITFRESIMQACGIDIDTLKTEEDVRAAAAQAKLAVDFGGAVGYGECVDALFKDTARKALVGPVWILDYPIALKPLARANPEDPSKSASAQLVVMGAEIVNAYYHELNDPMDQRARFNEQQELREAGSEEAQWLDESFLDALETGMPPAAGMGLGVDRLVALLTGSHSLKEVILFPTLKPRPKAATEGSQEGSEE
ncbi:lysine--tRNA ligase [Patescibacteria group bacterium]|nr:lysine--tRNA ligase [Patescibacteria group bacterium]